MAKQIVFEYENKEYTLEFTRKTVKKMEGRGFNIAELETKPVTRIPELFAGAFLENHGGINGDTVNKIFERFTDKEGLIGALGEMYADTLNTLTDEPEKNGIGWVKSW